MLILWIARAISLFFVLLITIDMVLWIVRSFQGWSRLRDQRLWREDTSTLVSQALLTPAFLMFALYPYLAVLAWIAPKQISSDSWIKGLLLFAGGMFLLMLPLWGSTVYLRFRAQKQPIFCYFLPQDADAVRLHKCVSGMALAASLFPNIIQDRDQLDVLARALEVATRLEVFPQGSNGQVRLTNNFSVYCDLAAESTLKGYEGMVQLYARNPLLAQDLKTPLEDYPTGDLATKERLYALARDFLSAS